MQPQSISIALWGGYLRRIADYRNVIDCVMDHEHYNDV